MEFTIYTLGDVALFRNALNGVAMMFKVASGGTMDIWASNSGWGLGFGALLGALMALLIMVYNGALKRQLDWRGLLFPLLLYYVLTVPKATVVIMDAYSNQAPSRVDNVPFGLAFPLGIISQITYSATVKLETVFYVPYNGFTKITNEGYVAPLKLLNAIRYTGITASGAMPNLRETINEAHHICLTNNNDWDVNEYNNAVDSLSVLVKALQSPLVENRYVIVPTANAGKKVMSCSDASVYITDGINAYITGTNTNALQMLSNEQLKTSNLKTDASKIQTGQNGSKQGLPDMSTSQILQTMANMASADNATIMAFMQQTILNPTLSAVTECAIDSDPSSQGRCASYYTSVEQWKEKAAADASGFVAIMRDGQNLLIVLSIILFPIMVVILVLQGQSAMKILGSYILYTVSAFMWLPVAAIINFYTHLQLHEELNKWNPTGNPDLFLSLKNAPAFYDAVSKKLALANHALASVPMLCMGLFSGMLMTMNRLSDRWNTQSQYYDPKTNVPDAIKRDPIAEVGPTYSSSGMNSIMEKNGVGNAWEANMAREASNARSQIEGLEKSNTELLQQTYQNSGMAQKSYQDQYSFVKGALEKTSFGKSEGGVTDDQVRAGIVFFNNGTKNSSDEVGSGSGTTNTNQLSTVVGANAGAEIGGGVGADATGQKTAKSAGKIAAGANVARNDVTANTTSTSETNKLATRFGKGSGSEADWAQGKSTLNSWSNQQKREFESSINASLAQTATDTRSSSMSSTQAKQISEATNQYKQNQQAITDTTRLGIGQKLNSIEFANRSNDNAGFKNRADNLTQQVVSNPEAKQKYDSLYKEIEGGGYAESSLARTHSPSDRQNLSNIVAMRVASEMGGELGKSALNVFSPTSTAPSTLPTNFTTDGGLEAKNAKHIDKVASTVASVQEQTKDLDKTIPQKFGQTQGKVQNHYQQFDAHAHRQPSSKLQSLEKERDAYATQMKVNSAKLRDDWNNDPNNPANKDKPKE